MRDAIDRARRRLLGTLAVLPGAALLPGLAAADSDGRAHGRAVVDVREFGARGDGSRDDTAAFQRAVDALPASGGTIRVPSGRYLIDPLRSIRLRSRQHLSLAADARLLAIPNAAERAYVVLVQGVSDVEISGGRIVGERDLHRGRGGEWGHGIMVRGAERVTVRDIHISRCWGDGISIGAIDVKGGPPVSSSDVTIARVSCAGNRRQGLTIGRSRRVRVHDCEFSGTAGTAPQAGIDVEPDAGAGTADVRIERCRIHGNRGPGIQLWKRVREVVIADCVIENNRGHGILLVDAGDVDIDGNRLLANTPAAIGLRGRTDAVRLRGNRFVAAATKGKGRAKGVARHIRMMEGAVPALLGAGNVFD